MLVVDPNKRYSAQKIVDHPWLSKGKALELELPITKNMKEVMAKRKLKVGLIIFIILNIILYFYCLRNYIIIKKYFVLD